jgi:hypothetical protein
MSIISEIAQGLSSILKKNQKPVMQYAENIALVAEVPFDKEKVNQCQGFTYNPQTEKFIVACINADSTIQILYELNKDFTVARSVENTGADKLGHCNTLFFDGKLRATNGAANGNRIYAIDDNLNAGEYKNYTDRFYNVGYNNVTGQYVSILPGEDNSTRKIKIYANSDLTDGKEYIITVNEKNNDSNGALFVGNKVIFSLMRRIVEVEIGDNTATIVRELEFEPKAEIEDFALVDGAIYMAANSHDYIRIYKYDFARSYYNNINNDFLNNGIVVGNQVGYHGQSVDKATNYVMAKINANNNLEVGDKRNLTTILGKEFKHYNGTNSYTVLTTYHYDKAIYNKTKTDELFVKKAEISALAGGKKSLNVVTEGVDNTGATDVTAKLNEIFVKANAEKYDEVIFPDGIYKISNKVKILCPLDRNRYLTVKSETLYGAVINCDHDESDSSVSTIGFILSCVDDGNSDYHDIYNTTIEGFSFKVAREDMNGSYIKFIGNDGDLNANYYNFIVRNIKATNTKDAQGQIIDFDKPLNNSVIDNIEANYGQYAIYIEVEGSNTKISNVISNNCTFGICSYSYVDINNVLIHYDDNIDLVNLSGVTFYANKINNLKLTGRWNLATNLLNVNAIASTELNNIHLDVTHSGEKEYLPAEEYPTPFIKLDSPNDDKAEIKINGLKFPNFAQNFAALTDRYLFSWIDSPEFSIAPNNVEEYDKLKLFTNLGSTDEYGAKGYLNRRFEVRAEEDAKTRVFVGRDRTIRNADDGHNRKNQLFQEEGSAIYFNAKGTPVTDVKDNDYSRYAAGVSGDLYIESDPKATGHLGYVSTYKYTTETEYVHDKPTSVVNHGDRTMTVGFDVYPVWQNGSHAGKPVEAGASMEALGKGNFPIVEADPTAKTMKLSIPEVYKADVVKAPEDFNMEIYFKPESGLNIMSNMTYETIPVIHSGPTENRPTEHLVVGQQYFDTTLEMPVFWNGTKWVVSASDVGEKLKEYVRIDKIFTTDVTQPPAFAGQMAILNNTLYIAESTDLGSWRMVTLQPNDHL